jgi:tripartite-type tricarboxylate transporter receptor subunit TctC
MAETGSRFPDHAIRFVVPNNAGGIADSIARFLQNVLAEELGQPVVIENRPGASGAIAGTMVAQSLPDGHTWLIDGPSNVILPLINKSMSVNYRTALAPVAQVMDLPYVFGVREEFPAGDLPALVAEARRRPGEVTFGTTGAATTGHFMGELLQQYAGIKLNHIPFKGGSEISRELLAGRIDMGMLSYNSLLPALQSKGARVIAVPGGHRHPSLPDVPAVAETYPGYSISSWTGLFVPAATPDHIQNRIVEALHVALKNPKVAELILKSGCDPTLTTRNEFRDLIEHDRLLYTKLIGETGLRPE